MMLSLSRKPPMRRLRIRRFLVQVQTGMQMQGPVAAEVAIGPLRSWGRCRELVVPPWGTPVSHEPISDGVARVLLLGPRIELTSGPVQSASRASERRSPLSAVPNCLSCLRLHATRAVLARAESPSALATSGTAFAQRETATREDVATDSRTAEVHRGSTKSTPIGGPTDRIDLRGAKPQKRAHRRLRVRRWARTFRAPAARERLEPPDPCPTRPATCKRRDPRVARPGNRTATLHLAIPESEGGPLPSDLNPNPLRLRYRRARSSQLTPDLNLTFT
jgi:hypothetical protein